MSMQINFTNRETYLAWRANWRAAYAEQSQEIRDIKKALVAARGNEEKCSSLQSDLHHARRFANRMMETLVEAKEEAQKQYQCEKAKSDRLASFAA